MELDLREPLRYLGVRGELDPALLAELSDLADRLTRTVTPRWVWRAFPVSAEEGGVSLEGSGLVLPGELARTMLAECGRAVLLACTLGAGFEAMLRAEQARSMARAAMLDACGSAWVEAGCDAAEAEISARFPDLYRTDRFSPGYGDLPLALQRQVCAALDASRRLGVQVGESCLMNPSKSVTAVIGLRPNDRSGGLSTAQEPSFALRPNDRFGGLPTARIRGCGSCNLRESCQYRKEGKTCGA